MPGNDLSRPEPWTPEKLAALKATWRGAKGIVKALTGKDPASPETIAARLAICEPCEDRAAGRCKRCKCFIKLKVRLAGEKCPLGKW